MGAKEPGPFGVLLRDHRDEAGLTQEELAERAGLSARVVSDLERGVTRAPQRHTIQRLADALGLSEQDRAAFRESAPRRPRSIPFSSTTEAGRKETPGIRTFLIADIRGYTRFTREQGDDAAARLASRFAAITREVVTARRGEVIELRGDEALTIFDSGRHALRAALDLQQEFARETERNPAFPLSVGMGLDAGEAVPVDGGFRGGALNLAARLCSLAGSGEVLASEGLTHLTGKVEGLTFVEREAVQVKGYGEPIRLVQVLSQAERAATMEAPGTRAASVPLPRGGFLGAVPSEPLVARQEELERILTEADVAAGGSGRLMVLAGEAGVGKTRLAQEVMLALSDRGFLVASGRCYEPRQTLPYYPFLEALTMAFESAPSTVRGQASQRWPSLAFLLPDQLGQPPASSIGGQDEQQRLFRAVTAFLVSVAEGMPVALLLDDLHWADSASLDLLQHLARHTRASAVLLLGTHRDIEVGRPGTPWVPLERALRDLNREGLLERLPVRRLDQEGTATLIAANVGQKTAPSTFSALVHRHTEGNPFFTREVLRALMERGDIYQKNGEWQYSDVEMIEVPESVRSTIAERASRLSERAQEVLHEASVLGQTFSFDDLQAMSDRAEEEIEAALEEATATGLVRETGGDGYTFNHALTQQTLYAELSGRRKRRLHLAVGEGLERQAVERRREQAAEVAWHLLRGGQPERALPYSLLAGDAAERVFAHAEAERHYRTALELARELGDREHEAEALEKLGGVLRFLARHDQTLEVLEQAAQMYRAVGDREGEGRVEAEIGMAHFARGTSDEGIIRLQPRLLSLKDHVSLRALCTLYEAQSQLFFGTSQYVEHLESAERWVQAAQETGDRAILARARGRHGTALQLLGRVEESIAAHEEAIALAEAAGEMYALMFALNDLAEAYQMGGALDKAMVLRERYLEVTKQMGYQEEVSLALCGLAQTLLLLGEWQRAREQLDGAAATIQSQTSWYAMAPPLTLAELSLLEGDHDAARRYLAEGMGIAERNKDLLGIRFGQLTQAKLDLANGQPEAAAARLEPLLDRPGFEETPVTWLLPVLAEARLELARDPESLQQAVGTVHEALRRAGAQSNQVQLVHALRVQGMLLTRKGRFDEAEHAFQEAISLTSSMPYPYAEARTLYESGMLHRTRGEHRQARERLEEALVIFQHLAARRYVERTEHALHDLG